MKNRRLEILGILLITFSLLYLVSLIGYNPLEEPGLSLRVKIENPMGIVGVFLAHLSIKLGFGYAILFLPLIGFAWGWWFFSKTPSEALVKPTCYVIGFILLLSVTVGWVEIVFGRPGFISYQYSGLVGGTVANLFKDFLGAAGSAILIIAIWIVTARGYFEWNFYTPFNRVIENLKFRKSQRAEKKKQAEMEQAKRRHTEDLMEKLTSQQLEIEPVPPGKTDPMSPPEKTSLEETKDLDTTGELAANGKTTAKPKIEPLKDSIDTVADDLEADETGIEVGEMVVEKEVSLDDMKNRQAPKRQYQLPKSDLLTTPVVVQDGLSKEELIDRANFLTQSLATFGVEGKVVNVHPGPVITLFEVEPAEGVRVNKFVQLSDDLARVMEASRVRVIAPIPGKSSVGIEIPNVNPATVYFKSVINSEKFANTKSKLTLAVGKTTSGEIATLDLAKMPHLLIAGTTGSGKSVCLNTIICSILYQATPEEVKFIIIDPKKVEMTLYRSLENYYLLGTEDIDEPIVTTPENAILALKALEKEMDRRYNVLADAIVRNIDEYNLRMEKSRLPIMPYIVLIVDELADLMMMSAKDVEAPIARLAQLARAVGIHLVIATQRPSVDVITGIIKANFPARIAFQVATKIDSRTILDTMGAEKLIGRGDMLHLGIGSSEPYRLHNAYISLEEIEAIMNHISTQPQADEMKLASVREISPDEPFLDGEMDDELFKEAIKLVITHQQGSISLIQRRLKVGYSRAARMIDMMEQIGVVGPFTGSKAREVLVDELYLQTLD